MNQTLAIIAKDLRLLWRERAGWISAAVFAASMVMTFSFAMDLATGDVDALVPGVLWTTFLFAGIVASEHSFGQEVEDGTMDAVLLAPVPREALYLGKAIANLAALLVVEAAVLLLATTLFGVSLLNAQFGAITLVGTVGFVALVTLLSTLGHRTRSRAILMPVLTLPLLVPLLIAAVRASAAATGATEETAPWFLLLLVFALWTTVGGVLLFPSLVEQ